MRVLVLDSISEAGLSLLRDHPDIELDHVPDPDSVDLVPRLREAEALIVRARHLSPKQWSAATRLRIVSRHGVGCDNVDFERMAAMGVTVAIAADANYISVAEHAFALMLGACRDLRRADQAARSGAWASRDSLGTREVNGADVLVVGYGRIGQAFAARARAFGASITVVDPALPTDAALPEGMRLATDLPAAVGAADIISLHLPAIPATRNLFDAALLARCRPGAILVNTGRGGIVDEVALCAALDDGRPGFYATDVLADEPPPSEHPLLARPDVLLTPHSAAMTAEGAERMAVGSATNVIDFLHGRLPPRMVAFAPPSGVGD
jgi:phosphoglycerate dehydrogenase-like enzyme